MMWTKGHLTQEDAKWLRPIASVPKVDFNLMLAKVLAGEWSLWRLESPAQGVAVTYPFEGTLFIYYLSGRDLFGKLKSEDLLGAARLEGLNGVKTETTNAVMLRLLQKVGFEIYAHGLTGWCLELNDGR